MNKAEEFYNNMKTPLPSTLDGYVRKSVMFEFAEQYAQQVKRDEMEKAYIAGMQREASTGIEHRPSTSNFNEWYTNHQNQEK